MSPDTRAAIAFSRFGLGITPRGLGAALSDAQGALLDELKNPPALTMTVSDIQRELGFSTALPPTPELLAQIAAYNRARKDRREMQAQNQAQNQAQMTPDMAAGKPQKGPQKGPQKEDDTQRLPQAVTYGEVGARLNAWGAATIGFHERLVMFWANHFAVSADKGLPLRVLAGAYEREAIRPHVTGRFRDLLLAAERHPAMQLYLDNDASIGPNARANRNGKRGLNENLAREIMELHTLGVNGGYSQTDVTSFAKVITGWGVDRGGRSPDGFRFNANAHEPGAQTVLGKRYADDGERQGVRVLEDLARHPATAKHIATKLVRHFVSDQPPAAVVERVTQRFLDTDGDLTQVYAALIEAEESWTAPRAKLRTPQEYVIASLRALDTPIQPQRFAQSLRVLGQPLWQPPGPNGFSDLASVWATPEGLNNRLDLAYQLSERPAEKTDPRRFAEDRLKGLISETTRRAVALAETRPQGLALVLLSPEFMRR
ncbi:DUF1800 family protein [Asticcacaulis sp. AND118]|uniref:DUF1800 domain-containing protein n=1 Tax=Asticcacaulis sp. AND118 TaxID=2840468 RepID=UPI001D000571|nr:DUF1800 family protein [Asticcacaulis sp. AND118]UDF02767.1 DUF1800 family protein [Asticcacaulis sp. AND118]